MCKGIAESIMKDIDVERLRENGEPLRVLYLFSGRRRQHSVRTELERLTAAAGVQLEFSDRDLLNGDNLLGRRVQKNIIKQIRQGHYHVVLASPRARRSRGRAGQTGGAHAHYGPHPIPSGLGG